MIKLKDLLKESTWNNRKFGEPLPTMADYKKAHDKKNIKEDFKNNKWEVYVADENRREKIVKVAKSKRAAVILYNKLINTDKYHEVGMRVIKEGVISEGTDFVVNVQDTRKKKKIQSGHFSLKDDANKYIKDMMKKHKLKRQKGFWGNPKTGVEMITNF